MWIQFTSVIQTYKVFSFLYSDFPFDILLLWKWKYEYKQGKLDKYTVYSIYLFYITLLLIL